MMNLLKGKTVFITGGSGFVGGRLVEILVREREVKVRALVHNPASALRMARFDIEFAFADLTDQVAIDQATQGCEIIFHCAFGKAGDTREQTRVTVEGTRVLAIAALKNRVSRLVNLSTAAVYGATPDREIDETFPSNPGSWHYARMKWDAEKVLRSMHRQHRLPFTTLQLVGVYGPWGEVFTISPLEQLARGRVVLVNDGCGVMNATYVDDVVQAMVRAAVQPQAIGETFLVKGAGRVTRRQFYEAYARMLEVDDLIGMTPKQITEQRRSANRSNLRRLAPLALRALRFDGKFREAFSNSAAGDAFQVLRQWLPKTVIAKLKGELPSAHSASGGLALVGAHALAQRPLILPSASMVRRLAAQTEFSCRKAEKLLGYNSKFNLARGMSLTEQWARWARLVPDIPAAVHSSS
jgi:nucleoside-diphosphate-sugar epimerase